MRTYINPVVGRWELVAILSAMFSVIVCVTNVIGDDKSEYPYTINIEPASIVLVDGDKLAVTEVQGSITNISKGGRYLVKGICNLKSRSNARLTLLCTEVYNPPEPRPPSRPIAPKSSMLVSEGTNSFALVYEMMADGYLHVTLCDVKSWNSFGDLYFGEKGKVFQKKKIHKQDMPTKSLP